jgi:NitT/TauT family transport system substrate-binding protein
MNEKLSHKKLSHGRLPEGTRETIPAWSRRQALWLLAGAMGGVALHGCTKQTQANSAGSTSAPKSVSVGVVAWPGYAGHYVALEKGFYKEQGIDVQETFFQDGTTQTTAFLASKFDLSWGTSADAIQNFNRDPSIKIIKLVDYSNGADGILGRGIKQPQDLKGKKVAREDLLFENLLLQSYLDKAGLTLADVQLIDAPAATAASAFVGKQVDVAITYEPYLTKSAKAGGGEVVYSTKGTNVIADVIEARDSVIASKRDAILAYIRAVDKAVKLVNSGDQEALAIVGKRLGASVEETKQQLTGLKIFDIEGNKQIGFNPSAPNNLIKNLEFTNKVATQLKVIPQPLDVSKLYDDSLIKAL